MPHSRISGAWLAIIAVAIICGCGRGQSTAAAPADEASKAPESRPPGMVERPSGEQNERIQKLIEQLASRPEWRMKTAARSRSPKGGDSFQSPDKQRVVKAADALSREGPAAFLPLADFVDDRRYSFTLIGANGNVEETIGAVCWLIIHHGVDVWNEFVELFGDARDAEGRRVFPPYVPFGDALKQWVHERRGRTLNNLRIEATDRAIEFYESAKGLDFPLHGGPPEETEQRRKKTVDNLKSLLQRLKDGEEVAPRRSFFDSHFRDQGA